MKAGLSGAGFFLCNRHAPVAKLANGAGAFWGIMMEKFSFDAAFNHFHRTEGPKGFVWKFFLTYMVLMGIYYTVFGGLFLSSYLPFVGTVIDGGEPDPAQMMSQIGVFLGIALLAAPVFLIIYAMLEASALRRYIRKEGFSIGLGGDEWRIVGVYLLWFVFSILAYLAMMIAMLAIFIPIGLISGGGDNAGAAIGGGILAFFLIIALICLMVFLGIRFSAASAVTMRDRKVSFLKAWGATKGRFWPMFGAFLLIYVIVYLVQMAVQTVFMFILMGGMMSNIEQLETIDDPSELIDMMMNPVLLIGILMLVIAQVAVTAFMHYGFLGVTSKVALTDPRWSGRVDETAVVFE